MTLMYNYTAKIIKCFTSPLVASSTEGGLLCPRRVCAAKRGMVFHCLGYTISLFDVFNSISFSLLARGALPYESAGDARSLSHLGVEIAVFGLT